MVRLIDLAAAQTARFVFPALIAVSCVAAPLHAQSPRLSRGGEAAGQNANAANRPEASSPANDQKRLPADSVTEHSIDLSSGPLKFSATAETIPLLDAESGALQAEIGVVSYAKSGDGPARPVTFVFNGGPGAASGYLNIGAVGPWRLPLERSPSEPPTLMANNETWLAFTDLVFIDPPATGYSKIVASGDGVRRQFFSIDGDANALAVVIRKWVEKHGRTASMKYLLGESYGGFRAPKIARKLASDQGIGIRGMVLVSPVLDFGTLGQRRHSPLAWVGHLPSMAATAMHLKAANDNDPPFDREVLREAENYASGDYLRDLMRGERDKAAVERMTARVSALTGLDPALVSRLAGRIDTSTFQREIYRGRGLVGSAYDPTVTALDPNPTSASSRFPDPVLDGTRAPLTAAMTDLYAHRLNWKVDAPYRLLNGEVSGSWNWGQGRNAPEVVDDLRQDLAADPAMRVMVAHGAGDLVTPYFANQLILDQLPAFGAPDRVKLSVYGGGHMFYSRSASRIAFRNDAEALYRASSTDGARD